MHLFSAIFVATYLLNIHPAKAFVKKEIPPSISTENTLFKIIISFNMPENKNKRPFIFKRLQCIMRI